MEQLLAHLFGDYVLQNDWMANNKTNSWWPAFVHALTYSLPFIFLTQSLLALFVIFSTHLLIDHYRIARLVVFAKNWLGDRRLKWEDCRATGYHKEKPIWLAVWLLILVDNTLHLGINYAAIRWL